jgi:hypothetical protein
MKAPVVRKAGLWILRCFLLVGLGYSVLSLMLTTSPAYASSCVCNGEQFDDAVEYCEMHGYGTLYIPSYSCSPSASAVTFFCTNTGIHFFALPCD